MFYTNVYACMFFYPLANKVTKGYSNASFRPSVTYLVLMRIWNPIDFQDQRARSQGLIFRRGDTPRFALPLFCFLFLLCDVM